MMEGKQRKRAGESLEAAPGKEQKVENKFSKEQLLAAGRFQDRRDMVDALLKDDERYTVKDVEEMIRNYGKGRVK